MKKILIISLLIGSAFLSQAQGVKISAMPQWTTSLDSVWFPIIDHSTAVWVNYRAQGWQIGKERIDSIINNWPTDIWTVRIDSIVNNWPSGGVSMRFGYTGEDDANASGEDRLFTLGAGVDYASFTIDLQGNAPYTNQFIINTNDHGSITFNGNSSHNSFFVIDGETSTISAKTETNSGFAYGGFQSQAYGTSGGGSNDSTRAQLWNYNGNTNVGAEFTVVSAPGYSAFRFRSEDNHQLIMSGNLHNTNRYSWEWILEDLETGSPTSKQLYWDNTNNHVIIADAGGGGGSSTKFGVSGEDDAATEDRLFALTSHTFQVTGAYSSSGNMWLFTNSGTGTTVGVLNNGGSSTMAVQNNGNGNALFVTGTSGNAINATTTSGAQAAALTVNPSSTNTTQNVLTLQRLTSGTAAASMAGAINYVLEVNLDGSTTATSNKLISMWTDPANATRSSKFIIQGVTGATNTDLVEFLGDGNIRQLVTGKGYGLKSPDGTTWYITVNNSGVLSTSTSAP